MDPREYDWQMGALVDPGYLAPDERRMRPPPADATWPHQALPSPGDAEPWQAPPTRLERWPVDPSQMTANEAAAFQTQARYRNALARDPTSNRMGALAEMVAPQTPLDYALLASGPLRAAAVPLRAAIYGGAAALQPEEAQAGPSGIIRKGAEAVLGLHPTTSPRTIYNKTLGGGYSVNLPTGAIPSEGLMVGRYPNSDPRNLVIPREEFKQAAIKQHAETNAAELAKPESYLGTWLSPEGKVYLDVSQRYDPDKIRAATKAGERTGQLAGYNVGAGESFPIGSWRDFVSSPEFHDRMNKMATMGREYLNQFPSKEWWDMHGSSFERAYGPERLPHVAGFSASTAPVSNPYDNMRTMSEYMRRHIAGEPIIQPDWRAPAGGMWLSEGKQLPLEQSRIPNLEKSARGDLAALQRAKVREEAAAMMGDPNAVVLDRHWARLTEAPERGIYANAQEGVINTNILKRGLGDYDFVKNEVSKAARAAGRDPRDFSADAWTGIRETIKNTSELFGTKHKGSAITGESKSYADIFQELLEKKAKHLGTSADELDKRLRRGEANLLSTMLVSSPALAAAYRRWQADQGDHGDQGEAMGGLVRQD